MNHGETVGGPADETNGCGLPEIECDSRRTPVGRELAGGVPVDNFDGFSTAGLG